MEIEKCRYHYCQHPIQTLDCSHITCKGANAQGFCSTVCRTLFREEMFYLLKKAANA